MTKQIENAQVRKVYMHTINGYPARYIEGQQIVYLTSRSKNVTRSTLAAIKFEQKQSAAWRKRKGMTGHSNYGFVMFYMEKQP